MKNQEIDNKIAKLPKWAQEYIRDLKREREAAIDALNKYVDEQTSSPFFIDDLECTGETVGPTTKIRYIQTDRVCVNHTNVHFEVLLRDDYIQLRWNSGDKFGLTREVSFIPESYQSARLVAKENMR